MKREKITQSTLKELFGFKSRNTLNDWNKSEQRLVLVLIRKYFNETDINEFLESRNISRMQKYKDYEFLYMHTKKDIYKKCYEFEKEHKETCIVWSSFISTLDNKIEINSCTIEKYNEELFENILILFNEYLLKRKIKDYRKHMNDIEEFYNSLCVLPYKFYFYKDEMWKLNNYTSRNK